MSMSELSWSIQAGKAEKTAELVRRALGENYQAEQILREGLMKGIALAEERWASRFPPSPELLISRRALKRGIEALREAPAMDQGDYQGTVIAGAVRDDLSDTDKNLGVLLMELMGLQVIDLGVSVGTWAFIEAAKVHGAQIIACQAARLGSLGFLKNIVQGTDAAGLRDRVKVLVTGKSVTEPYRAHIRADLYAPDMISAAEIAAAHCRRILLPAA
jgi:methanogenic corrinoid protein MtbC1